MIPAYKSLHRLALAAMLVMMIMSIATIVRLHFLPVSQRIFQSLGNIAIWGFFIRALWKWPRAWSLGLGILFCLMLIFQTFLWRKAVSNPDLAGLDLGSPSPWIFALYEIPLVVAIVSCFLLRFNYPQETQTTLPPTP